MAIAAGIVAPANAQLVPHRAVYDISLERADEGGTIASFNGRMVIEVVASDCDGIATNSRYVFRSGSAEGSTLLTDLRTAQWEAMDASSFRFLTRRYDDANLTEETDGNAERTSNGVRIAIKAPKEGQVRFNDDVMFPTQHLNRLIEFARASKHTLSARLYEGADPGTQIYDTFAVIGSAQNGDDGLKTPGSERLKGLSKWPVTISYFPGEGSKPEERETAGGEEVPVYAISSLLYENGVSRDILLDYGEFSLRGTLSTLSFPEKADCAKH